MNLDTLAQIKKEADAKLRADGEAAIRGELRAIFDEHDCLEAIRWRQYVPYFNDGEACTFSIHEPEVKCGGLVMKYGEPDDGWIETYGTVGDACTAPAKRALDAVRSLYRKLQEIDDVVAACLGEHAEVTCTREGVTVEEYTHHD
jgi:hypothetical protein